MLRVSAGHMQRACRVRAAPSLSSSSAVLRFSEATSSSSGSSNDSNNNSYVASPVQHANIGNIARFNASATRYSTSTFGSSLFSSSYDNSGQGGISGISRRAMSTNAGDGDSTTFTTGDLAPAPPISNTSAAPTADASAASTASSDDGGGFFSSIPSPFPNPPPPPEEALPFEPTWWPSDQVIQLLNFLHDTTGLQYAGIIAGTTVAIRIALFPLFVKAQRNTSRMAHMKPEMDVLKAKIDQLGPKVSQEEQMKHARAMKALFKKYDCNPLKALAVPFVQAPVFMSMFFGLRKMPEYFPQELANGGALWFPDLTHADPYYIMPVASAAMFIAMINVGKEQMIAGNPQQGPIMLKAFYGLGILMIPITMNFPAAVFCYWTTNNLISLGQSILFRDEKVKKMLGIWDPPPPVPGQLQEAKGFMEQMQGAFEKSDAVKEAEKIKLHNEAIERQKVGVGGGGEKKAGRNRRRGRKR